MIADDLQQLARPISDLTVWDKNYRQGDVGAVSLSLERFGQCKPIVGKHYGKELRIIAGNHTLLAAQGLGWSELAVVVRDDLTEEEALAYAIADNRTSDLATNDEAVLLEHLQAIAADDTLLLASAYDGDDVDFLAWDVARSDAGVGNLLTDANTQAERAEVVEAAGIRSIIMPFALGDYNLVVARFAELRTELSVDSNAEVMLRLLAIER